jgi:hypothetical protein
VVDDGGEEAYMIDHASLVGWVREHERMSAHTFRRRLGVTRPEADQLVAELVQARVLSHYPEGDSYRVLYRRQPNLRHIVRTSKGAVSA